MSFEIFWLVCWLLFTLGVLWILLEFHNPTEMFMKSNKMKMKGAAKKAAGKMKPGKDMKGGGAKKGMMARLGDKEM